MEIDHHLLKLKSLKKADELYEYFCNECSEVVHVEKGIFQTHMEVSLVNEGPCTIVIEK